MLTVPSHRHKLRSLYRDLSGATAPVVAVLMLTFFSISAFTIDISRYASVRSRAQAAIDSAALAATISSTRRDITTEANNFFRNNFQTGYMNATFGNVVASRSADGLTYNYTVRGYVPYALAHIVGARAGQEVVVSASVQQTNIPTELALVLETSWATTLPGAGGSKLDNIKQTSSLLLNELFQGRGSIANTYVSTIPYSDGIRTFPTTANPWLRMPYSPIPATFGGCIGTRKNIYDTTDEPPVPAIPSTLFDRYRGPLEGGLTVMSYDINGTPKNIPYVANDTATGVQILFADPENLTATPGRIPNELDFMPEFGRSEAMYIYFGTPVAGLFVNAISGFMYDMFFLDEGAGRYPERGITAVYNASGALMNAEFFYGVTGGHRFDIPLIGSPDGTPVSIIGIWPVDNGQRDVRWGGGPWLDNSDFRAFGFYLPTGNCLLGNMSHFAQSRAIVDNYIRSLPADGGTFHSLGIAWGWRALSQRWAGVLLPTVPYLPLPNGNSQKIIVMMAGGDNTNPAADNAQFATTCNNVRAAGIRVYTIAMNASPQTAAMLRSCATAPDMAFEATNIPSMQAAAQTIGSALSNYRLVQ